MPCKISCHSYTVDLPVQKTVGCCCFCSWHLSTMRWKASSWLPSSGLPSADGSTSCKTIVQAHSSPKPWQEFCSVTIYGTGVWDFYLYSFPNCNRHVSSNSFLQFTSPACTATKAKPVWWSNMVLGHELNPGELQGVGCVGRFKTKQTKSKCSVFLAVPAGRITTPSIGTSEPKIIALNFILIK